MVVKSRIPGNLESLKIMKMSDKSQQLKTKIEI